MGYKRKPKTFLLEFEDEEYKGLEIEMKGLPVAGFLTMMKVMETEEKNQSVLATMFRLFATGLVSWNMEDEEGNPLPANYDSVQTLDTDFVTQTVAAWMEGMSGVSKDLGKDSPSGVKSPVPLPTMEAL
jgi:hypothetical protein